jgi:hypothetical protein
MKGIKWPMQIRVLEKPQKTPVMSSEVPVPLSVFIPPCLLPHLLQEALRMPAPNASCTLQASAALISQFSPKDNAILNESLEAVPAEGLLFLETESLSCPHCPAKAIFL